MVNRLQVIEVNRILHADDDSSERFRQTCQPKFLPNLVESVTRDEFEPLLELRTRVDFPDEDAP